MTLAQMVEMEARLHEIAAEQLRTTGGRRVLWWTPGQTTIDGFRALLSERFPPERVAAEVARVERAVFTLRGVHLPPSTFVPIDGAISRAAAAISHAVADRTNMLAAAYFLETDEPFEIVTEQRPDGWTWAYPRNCSGARQSINPAEAIEPAARFGQECPGCPASMMRLAYGFEGLTFVLRFEVREPE